MPMTAGSEVVEDYRSTGLTLRQHPVSFLRADLAARGIVESRTLRMARDGQRLTVAGLVLVRQKPGSASGVLFVTIEDETDRVDQSIIRRADGKLVCRGMAETRKLFEILEVSAESDMVTVAGFVADLVGRVPRIGDSVEWNGFRFTVTRATARRAERIEIEKLPNVEEPPRTSSKRPRSIPADS